MESEEVKTFNNRMKSVMKFLIVSYIFSSIHNHCFVFV